MGIWRDWALLGDRAGRGGANMNGFWVLGHHRWRGGNVQRDTIRRSATVYIRI